MDVTGNGSFLPDAAPTGGPGVTALDFIGSEFSLSRKAGKVSITSTPLGFFNVKDSPYGAKGDGATDDAPAIQAAANAVSAAGGGGIYFPSGTYALKSYITLPSNIYLLGQGRQTILKLVSGYVSGAQGQGHFFASGANDITIDSISFDGNSGTVSADPTNNFSAWFTNCSRCSVRNCYFTGINTGGSNINTAAAWVGGSGNYNNAIDNEFISCGGGAIFFQGTHSKAIGNTLVSCNDVGIVFNSSTCRFGVAVGNVIDTIPSQCAFGVENGAGDWTITGNTVKACFGALDLNDAGYAGSQVGGGVFANNTVVDLDKGSSAQTGTIGVFYRTAHTRNVKIIGNIFSGLVPYGTVDSFVFVDADSEGLEIKNNTFEGKSQVLPSCINVAGSHTQTRMTIEGNTFRSTSTTTKLSKGIWLGASSTYTNTSIARNLFENITNYGVHFDASVSFSGELRDNIPIINVTTLYQTSPWGTWANAVVPHLFRNSNGRSVVSSAVSPTTGTWQVGDRVWNTAPTATGTPGWICTTAGTPGTWTAMPVL